MSDVNAFAMEYRPTVSDRLWRALGWRYRMVDLPETPEVEAMPGWAMTHVRLGFSFKDRLRLLLTGRVRLDVRQKMNVVVDDIVSATSVEILPPWRGFRD